MQQPWTTICDVLYEHTRTDPPAITARSLTRMYIQTHTCGTEEEGELGQVMDPALQVAKQGQLGLPITRRVQGVWPNSLILLHPSLMWI